jgi:hypothetical protein
MVQLGKIRLAACIRSPVRIQIGAPGVTDTRSSAAATAKQRT